MKKVIKSTSFIIFVLSLVVIVVVVKTTKDIEYTRLLPNGAFQKIVDEDADGTADKVYTQKCFGAVPGGLWFISKPNKEEQEIFFKNRILAIR